MSTTSTTELPRRVLVRTAAGAAAVLLLTFWDWTVPWSMLGCWSMLIGVQLLLRPNARLGLLLFASLTLYCSMAFVVQVVVGTRFDPWPPLSVVTAATLEDLHALALSYVVVELLIGSDVVHRAVTDAAARLRGRLAAMTRTWLDSAMLLVLLAVGIVDTVRVLQLGLGTLLGSERRAYADALVLTSDHNVQVICMAITVVVVVRAAMTRRWRATAVSVAVCWTPFLLVGSRKEATVVLVLILLVLIPLMKRRLALICAAGGVAVFLVPIAYTGDWVSPLHEFILPQYMQFTIGLGLVPRDLGGTFLDRAQFLLPSGLRLSPIEDFGHAFGQLHVTGVGVGASPFAEADLNDFFGSPDFSFAILLVVACVMVVIAARRAPALALTGYALLVFYGRSDFWTFLFFAVYTALLISLLSRGLLPSRTAISQPGVQGALPSRAFRAEQDALRVHFTANSQGEWNVR